MNFTQWLRPKLEIWLGITDLKAENEKLKTGIGGLRAENGEIRSQILSDSTELRAENEELKAQLHALGNLQTDLGSAQDACSKRIDTIFLTTNEAVIEAEERLLIRVAALEDKTAGSDYTKDEASSPSGGFIPWSERKRRAEQAATNPDPNKWIKKPVTQEK